MSWTERRTIEDVLKAIDEKRTLIDTLTEKEMVDGRTHVETWE